MSYSKADGLRFNEDGNFKIMQISDIQDSNPVSADSMAFICAALDKEKPDLVVFTGDQIKGYSPKMRGKDAGASVKQVIDTILKPLDDRGIPFTFVFGNHDLQSPIALKEQLGYYCQHENCLAFDNDGIPGCANHNVLISSSDGASTAFCIYCIDSHGAAGTGYAPVEKKQIDWYISVRDALYNKNGRYIPSFVFQHIPVEEVFHVLKEVPKGTKGSVPAYRKRKGKFFAIDETVCREGGFIGEAPAIPDINNGEFEAMAERGDVLGIYFGHDHNNSFIGQYKGVDLGYVQGVGFSVYGPQFNRGVRIFDLHENEPQFYDSHTLTYNEVFGSKVKNKLLHYLIDKTPTSFDAAVPFVLKILGIIAAIVAIIVILVKIF